MRAARAFFALALVALCCLLCSAALAASATDISFGDGTREAYRQDGVTVERVNLYKKSGDYYLFLPAGWDRASLRVHCEGFDALTADAGDDERVPLAHGDVTDVFSRADRVRLRDGRGRVIANVRVMQGSLAAVFTRTASDSLRGVRASKDAGEPGAITLVGADGAREYAGGMQEMRLRGNTTAKYVKKPFQIKLLDKQELIAGAGKARTWILLADYLDLSLMRNRIVLDMAQYVGIRFAVACRPVDLYCNGEYLGAYLLTEKVQVNESRVDITDREDELRMLNWELPLEQYPFFKQQLTPIKRVAGFEIPVSPADLTGGYLFQIDKAYRVQQTRDHGYILTENGFGLLVESPRYTTRAQIDYVEMYINAFERAICTLGGVDARTGLRYDDLADVDSFALKYLLEDVSANFDAKAGSQYFYKDTDEVGGKLCAGPGWDYDLTFANCQRMSPTMPYLSSYNISGSWWSALYDNIEPFRRRVEALYGERYVPAIEVLVGERAPDAAQPLRAIDDYAAELAASADMNFTRYPFSTIKGYNTSVGRTHEESVRYLKRFLSQRKDALAAFYAER